MYPVPQIADLSTYSGQPQTAYTTFATAALAQAAIMFTFRTEITDPSQFTGYQNLTPADAQSLATAGICALADWIYLRQPYRQVIASPMQNETIGSYSYSKPFQMAGRNAAAMEVTGEALGIPLFDLAVQMLAKRTIAGGVYSGAISVFEKPRDRDGKAELRVHRDPETGALAVLGPADLNVIDWPMFDLNSEMSPHDPG